MLPQPLLLSSVPHAYFTRGHDTVTLACRCPAQSAAWDDNGVLIYTTLNHIKYCLPNGDHGIIRTLDVPVYITKVANQILYALDREGKNRQIQVCGGCGGGWDSQSLSHDCGALHSAATLALRSSASTLNPVPMHLKPQPICA